MAPPLYALWIKQENTRDALVGHHLRQTPMYSRFALNLTYDIITWRPRVFRLCFATTGGEGICQEGCVWSLRAFGLFMAGAKGEEISNSAALFCLLS